jgi:hypothetical protein
MRRLASQHVETEAFDKYVKPFAEGLSPEQVQTIKERGKCGRAHGCFVEILT